MPWWHLPEVPRDPREAIPIPEGVYAWREARPQRLFLLNFDKRVSRALPALQRISSCYLAAFPSCSHSCALSVQSSCCTTCSCRLCKRWVEKQED